MISDKIIVDSSSAHSDLINPIKNSYQNDEDLLYMINSLVGIDENDNKSLENDLNNLSLTRSVAMVENLGRRDSGLKYSFKDDISVSNSFNQQRKYFLNCRLY